MTAHDRYSSPLAERYARAGFKVMFCFTHQTYGEGRDEFDRGRHRIPVVVQQLTQSPAYRLHREGRIFALRPSEMRRQNELPSLPLEEQPDRRERCANARVVGNAAVQGIHGWEGLAERIPGVDAHLSTDDGHLTIQLGRIGDVHAWLLEHF